MPMAKNLNQTVWQKHDTPLEYVYQFIVLRTVLWVEFSHMAHEKQVLSSFYLPKKTVKHLALQLKFLW